MAGRLPLPGLRDLAVTMILDEIAEIYAYEKERQQSGPNPQPPRSWEPTNPITYIRMVLRSLEDKFSVGIVDEALEIVRATYDWERRDDIGGPPYLRVYIPAKR